MPYFSACCFRQFLLLCVAGAPIEGGAEHFIATVKESVQSHARNKVPKSSLVGLFSEVFPHVTVTLDQILKQAAILPVRGWSSFTRNSNAIAYFFHEGDGVVREFRGKALRCFRLLNPGIAQDRVLLSENFPDTVSQSLSVSTPGPTHGNIDPTILRVLTQHHAGFQPVARPRQWAGGIGPGGKMRKILSRHSSPRLLSLRLMTRARRSQTPSEQLRSRLHFHPLS